MVTSNHHTNLAILIITKFYLGPRCINRCRNSKLKLGGGACTRSVHSLTRDCGNEIQHFHLDQLSSLIAQCCKYLFTSIMASMDAKYLVHQSRLDSSLSASSGKLCFRFLLASVFSSFLVAGCPVPCICKSVTNMVHVKWTVTVPL